MIIWRDEMKIGIPEIDDDHKMLIAIVNEFDACQTLVCAETVAKKLYAYTQSHFKREEQIQDTFRYPYRHEQRHEHAKILADLKRLIKSGFIDKSKDSDDVVSSLSIFMREWIIGHVLQEDLKMKPFFKADKSSDLAVQASTMLKHSHHMAQEHAGRS